MKVWVATGAILLVAGAALAFLLVDPPPWRSHTEGHALPPLPIPPPAPEAQPKPPAPYLLRPAPPPPPAPGAPADAAAPVRAAAGAHAPPRRRPVRAGEGPHRRCPVRRGHRADPVGARSRAAPADREPDEDAHGADHRPARPAR